MVYGRDLRRRARKTVIERGWHNRGLIGRWLRALGKHMP